MTAAVEWAPEILAAVVDLRMAGLSWKRVSRHVGVSEGVLWKLRRRHAGTVWAEHHANEILFPPTMVAEVIRLRGENMPWVMLAEKIGVDVKVLLRFKTQHVGEPWAQPLPGPWKRILARAARGE